MAMRNDKRAAWRIIHRGLAISDRLQDSVDHSTSALLEYYTDSLFNSSFELAHIGYSPPPCSASRNSNLSIIWHVRPQSDGQTFTSRLATVSLWIYTQQGVLWRLCITSISSESNRPIQIRDTYRPAAVIQDDSQVGLIRRSV